MYVILYICISLIKSAGDYCYTLFWDGTGVSFILTLLKGGIVSIERRHATFFIPLRAPDEEHVQQAVPEREEAVAEGAHAVDHGEEAERAEDQQGHHDEGLHYRSRKAEKILTAAKVRLIDGLFSSFKTHFDEEKGFLPPPPAEKSSFFSLPEPLFPVRRRELLSKFFRS